MWCSPDTPSPSSFWSPPLLHNLATKSTAIHCSNKLILLEPLHTTTMTFLSQLRQLQHIVQLTTTFTGNPTPTTNSHHHHPFHHYNNSSLPTSILSPHLDLKPTIIITTILPIANAKPPPSSKQSPQAPQTWCVCIFLQCVRF